MSDLVENQDTGRYRPVGKGRFALLLVAIALGSLVVLLALDWLFGEGLGRQIGWIGMGLIWIVQSIRAILVPQRFRESVHFGPPLRNIRFYAAMSLIAWTIVTTTEIQKLFVTE